MCDYLLSNVPPPLCLATWVFKLEQIAFNNFAISRHLIVKPFFRSPGKRNTSCLIWLASASYQPSSRTALGCGSNGPSSVNTWTSRGAADGSSPPCLSSSIFLDNLVASPWFSSGSGLILPAVSSSSLSAFR